MKLGNIQCVLDLACRQRCMEITANTSSEAGKPDLAQSKHRQLRSVIARLSGVVFGSARWTFGSAKRGAPKQLWPRAPALRTGLTRCVPIQQKRGLWRAPSHPLSHAMDMDRHVPLSMVFNLVQNWPMQIEGCGTCATTCTVAVHRQ